MKIEGTQTASAPTLSVGRRNYGVLTAPPWVWLVRRSVLPRWLGSTAALLAAAVIASGIGLVLLNTALAQAVFVCGPLLLVWLTGSGVTLAGTSRSGAEA